MSQCTSNNGKAVDTIKDWDYIGLDEASSADEDVIYLCGQSPFFGVTKIDFFDFNNLGGKNDVGIWLSNGHKIQIWDAREDFAKQGNNTSVVKLNATNAENFKFFDVEHGYEGQCDVDCDVPGVDDVPPPFDEWPVVV